MNFIVSRIQCFCIFQIFIESAHSHNPAVLYFIAGDLCVSNICNKLQLILPSSLFYRTVFSICFRGRTIKLYSVYSVRCGGAFSIVFSEVNTAAQSRILSLTLFIRKTRGGASFMVPQTCSWLFLHLTRSRCALTIKNNSLVAGNSRGSNGLSELGNTSPTFPFGDFFRRSSEFFRIVSSARSNRWRHRPAVEVYRAASFSLNKQPYAAAATAAATASAASTSAYAVILNVANSPEWFNRVGALIKIASSDHSPPREIPERRSKAPEIYSDIFSRFSSAETRICE